MSTVVGEGLRHFRQGFCEWMPVSRRHARLGKHAKIGVQDTASSHLVELLQERNSHFHGGEMLGTALAAQLIRGRSPRLNGHPGDTLQIRTPVQHLSGLAPRAIQQHERRYSVRQPWACAQPLKERCIALRHKQIGQKSVISQKLDETCGRCRTVPWKKACMRDTRSYQTGSIGRLEIFVRVNEQPELSWRVNRGRACTDTPR